jgi:hypothetical protein
VIRVEAGRYPAGGVRAGGHARRTGRARGRHQDLTLGRGHPVPGRLGPGRASSPCPTLPSWPPATAREGGRARLSVRITSAAFAARTSAPGAEFVRYGGPHLMRGHSRGRRSPGRGRPGRGAAPDGGAPAEARRGSSWTRAPACAGSPGCSAARPLPAPSSSRTCTGITFTGCRFFRPEDRETRVTLMLTNRRPRTRRGVQVPRRCWPGDVPAALPITPAGLRGDWSFGSLAPGCVQGRGFHGGGEGGAAQGRRHLRLPGQRRGTPRWPISRSLPHRARPRPRRTGANTIPTHWPWPPTRTC